MTLFDFGLDRDPVTLPEFGAIAAFFRADPTGLYMNGEPFVAIIDTVTGRVRGAVRLSTAERAL